jgi:hypothetical protein
VRGREQETVQRPSRGSLLHPQEKGPEGERGVNSGRGGVGALLDFIFLLGAPTF